MELHQVPPRARRRRDRPLRAHHQAGEDRRRHREGPRLLTTFTRSTSATAEVDASREEIWAVLTDPDLLARLTPLVRSITDDGAGHWRWRLGGIDVLGASMAPSFTVAMVFDEPHRIDFTPAPPPGRPERAAVTGWYALEDGTTARTHLATSLEIALDLPLPRVSRRAVEASMQRVVDGMGDAFARNLLDHLRAHPA